MSQHAERQILHVPMDYDGAPTRRTIVVYRNEYYTYVVFADADTEFGHEALASLAEECEGLPRDAVPMGGVVWDLRNDRVIRGSHAFGMLDRDELDEILAQIEDGDFTDCEPQDCGWGDFDFEA